MEIKGLKRAAGITRKLSPYERESLQISYDLKTGEVLTDYFPDFPRNSWAEYNSSKIITVGFVNRPLTMVQIRGMVEEAVANAEAAAAEW